MLANAVVGNHGLKLFIHDLMRASLSIIAPPGSFEHEVFTKFENASRKDIDAFLQNKLSDALNYDQKKKKISNLLSNLRRAGVIHNSGSDKAPKWKLVK